MFDDTNKNMGNPETPAAGSINKLTWSNSAKSNITTLGDINNKTGLYAFNTTVKETIKYLYLNNNSFSEINALKDFTSIIELQMMCNQNLSNINGLENHSSLNYLTLHNCALNNSENTGISGLTGCNKLTKLSVQNNTNLESLNGIEFSTNLLYLIANNCNLTNIDGLKNHSKVNYLQLANNVNLESVKYIQHCKALNYIYLDNNVNMSTTELDEALNGTNSSIGNTNLIKQCANGFQNIPKKYWDLFTSSATVLDYSYEKLGEYLTIESPKWIKLKGRIDVTKLKLDGQIKLSMEDSGSNYGIYSTLKTMTGMKALALRNCNQINSLAFVKNMSKLCELDIRGISDTLVDYSDLNVCTNIKSLIIDNPNIDLKTLVTNINRNEREFLEMLSVIKDDGSQCKSAEWPEGHYVKMPPRVKVRHTFHVTKVFDKFDAFSYIELRVGPSNVYIRNLPVEWTD